MTHPKLILKMMQLPTIHLPLPSSKYALTRRYEFWYYRSFWKVNKNTFWAKASYMNMEDSIEMKQKRLLTGHPKLSKKSNNTSVGSKLRELCIGQVDFFCKIAKSQMCSNLCFLLNGVGVQACIVFDFHAFLSLIRPNYLLIWIFCIQTLIL